jgi:hypothetical protein
MRIVRLGVKGLQVCAFSAMSIISYCRTKRGNVGHRENRPRRQKGPMTLKVKLCSSYSVLSKAYA